MKKASHHSNHTFWIKIALCLCVLIPLLLFLVQKISPFQADVKHVTVNAQDVTYYTRGEGDPIILLGGFGMTMQDWDPLFIKNLSRHHQVIVIDYPASGLSGTREPITDQQELTQTIVGVMDHLEIKKTSVLGWSMGSFIAQLIAGEYPNRVDNLILIATAPGGKAMIAPNEEVGRTIQNNLEGSWEATYVPYLFPESADKEKTTYLERRAEAIKTGEAPKTGQANVAALIAFEKMFADQNREEIRFEQLAQIAAPTLIIAGNQDVLVPVKNSQNVAKLIPNAKLVVYPDAGHAVLFQEVDKVTKEIEDFLKN